MQQHLAEEQARPTGRGSRRIIDQHGGTIGDSSGVRCGTMATVRLPLHADAP